MSVGRNSYYELLYTHIVQASRRIAEFEQHIKD